MTPSSSPISTGTLTRLTRLVLRHRRAVVAFWLLVTVVGIAFAGRATQALSQEFSVPGREGSLTNAAITRTYGTGGNLAPLVAVATLPPGTSVDSAAVQAGLHAVATRVERALPHARIASYASTGSRAFVSADGRTTSSSPTHRSASAASVRTPRRRRRPATPCTASRSRERPCT
jgi:RND superfamily putative drug exporter